MRGPFPDLHRAISIFEIQFAGAQPLPDIQKEIFEIQLAGEQLKGPFPDLHIQFAGAVTTFRYPKGIFEIQLAGKLLRSPNSNFDFQNSVCSCCSHFHTS